MSHEVRGQIKWLFFEEIESVSFLQTHHVVIRFQGNLEDVTLLRLNQEKEHVL